MEYYTGRIKNEANYIIENKATVRDCGKFFGVSKSTIHKDVTKRLFYIDKTLHALVKEVLEQNKAQRHLRGGAATKEKYLAKRQQ